MIFKGNAGTFDKYALQDFQSIPKEIFQRNIKKVIFIQRGFYTQLYVLKELQNSLHFSLGSNASQQLMKICKDKNIQYEKYMNRKSYSTESMYLKNQLHNHLTNDSIEFMYTNKVIQLAKLFLPTLLSTSSSTTNRAVNVINLGVTNLKVHLHKRTTITGNQGLTLISAWTKKTRINNEALTKLGEFLMFMIKDVIPTTTFPDLFKPIHDIEKEYHQLFARQLNIFEEDELNKFNIPAVSLLINDQLRPHCDSLNPVNKEYDATLSITVHVPMSEVPKSITHHFSNRFTTTIPFCIVLYRRQCLVNISSHHLKIEQYLNNKSPYLQGRERIIQLLSHSVYSDIDYGGLFFTKHRQRLIQNKFQQNDNRIFKDKIALLNEAVDKCGYWSSLLHVFYMYVYINGLKRDDVLSFVLFFSHQCNTTIVLVQSMLDIMRFESSKKNKYSLYTLLCKACEDYKMKDNCKDVGCTGGIFQRFSPSNNSSYTEDQVHNEINKLNKLFAETTYKFQAKMKKKITPLLCFQSYLDLEKELLKLDGIGKFRATHLIQLSALLGLIPLHFYVYLPIHMSGGTGKFMSEELGYDKNSSYLQQYASDLTFLQQIYGINFTSNMFENMTCILGRGKEVYDLFYYLPWVSSDLKNNKPTITNDTNIQLTFRINVKSIKNIELLCRSNKKDSTVLSTILTTTTSNVLKYNKIKQNELSQDKYLLSDTGHVVDHTWMNNQYCNDSNTVQNLNITLPKFEDFYDAEVR